jgi:cytochrome c553
VICEKNPQKRKGNNKGQSIYSAMCNSCHNARYAVGVKIKHRYRNFKKDHCEICGFIASDPCQLDIYGNHENNDPTNFQTLCANCHRLKTKNSKEGGYARQHSVKAAVVALFN